MITASKFLVYFGYRNVSLQIHSEEEHETSQYDIRDGSSAKKERKASAATARFTIYKANKASKKKREKSSAKKERKATKTLAIVLGTFLVLYLTRSIETNRNILYR